jgi:hypothetical protein
MTKKEVRELKKKVNEYLAWHRDGESRDPFAYQNAAWAAGFVYFLEWLESNKK